jgi:Na+/melibiose symporter-like transporter
MTYTQNFIQFLQGCITPVALISGVGLLLLTITNRLGRTIDRTRQLVKELGDVKTNHRPEKEHEIKILYQRSRFLRISIGAMVVSVISSSLIIPLLFFMTLWEYDLRIMGYILFILSILSILISSLYFFRDVMLSLHALKLEAKDYLKA